MKGTSNVRGVEKNVIDTVLHTLHICNTSHICSTSDSRINTEYYAQERRGRGYNLNRALTVRIQTGKI